MDAITWAVDSIMIELGIMMEMDSWYMYQMRMAGGDEMKGKGMKDG